MLDKLYIDDFILSALKEDMPLGDITTDNIIEPDSKSKAVLLAKQDAVISGMDLFERVFVLLDPDITFKRLVQDGQHVKKGDKLLEFEGNTSALLRGERTALNFLQHLSGISTKTFEFSQKIKDLPVKVVDTRKTVPGMRYLDKYAVKMGGGQNHRLSLSDGVLIKDNHIKAAGGIKNAIQQVRGKIAHTIKIEVETESLDQVRESIEAGADIIMLDNMSVDMMKEAVGIINKKSLVEASGNVNIDSIYSIAATGVDIISVGELTHSVKAVDISMRFE
jgi:nicotinate-nucleotide pyrophosphorylase